MEVAASGADARVPERRLHEVDRRAAVERVAGVGVPEPMRRNLSREPGSRRGTLYDAVCLPQGKAAAGRLRVEDEGVGLGSVAQLVYDAPRVGREQHRTGFAALAVHRRLAGAVTGGEVTPAQADTLGDPQAGTVEHGEQGAIPSVGLERDHSHGVGLGEDALGERVLDRRGLQRSADVELQRAGLLGEREEALERRGRVRLCRRCLPLHGVEVGLQIGERCGGERPTQEGEEAAGLGAVLPAGVRAGGGRVPWRGVAR